MREIVAQRLVVGRLSVLDDANVILEGIFVRNTNS